MPSAVDRTLFSWRILSPVHIGSVCDADFLKIGPSFKGIYIVVFSEEWADIKIILTGK